MWYQDGSYDLVKAFYELSSIKKIWFSENNSIKKKKKNSENSELSSFFQNKQWFIITNKINRIFFYYVVKVTPITIIITLVYKFMY